MAGRGVEVGHAYVTVTPNADGFGKTLEGVVVPETDRAGGRSSDSWLSGFAPGKLAARIGQGLRSTLGNVAAGVGMQAGQMLGQALSGGFERLKSIDTASAKLRGLGMDTQTSATVMDNALASVKGTAFGMGEAAVTAAGAVAAGIQPGSELEQVLKNVANAAAATDSSMGDMGAIFNKVATTGKATNESLLQVADRGLPIYQALADQLGVTTADVEKMASKGEISFQQFSDAAAAAAGTVAEEMGGTATGSLANFGASLSRFGAEALSGIFAEIAPTLQEFTGWVDEATQKVKPFAAEFGAKLVTAVRGTIDWLKTDAIPAIQDLWQRLSNMVAWVQANKNWLGPLLVSVTTLIGGITLLGKTKLAMDAIMAAGGILKYAASLNVVKTATAAWTAVQKGLNLVLRLNPIGLVITAIAALVAGLVYAYQHSETFRNAVDGMFSGIKDVAAAVGAWFAGPFAGFFRNTWDAITGFFAAGANWIGSIVEQIRGFFTRVGDGFRAVGDGIGAVWTWITDRFQQAVDWLAGVFGPIWAQVSAILLLPINLARTLIGAAWDWITDRFQQAWTWISGVFVALWNGLVNLLSGPINAARDWIGNTWTSILAVFTTAWTNITTWVTTNWNRLTGLIGQVIDAARNWLSNTWTAILGVFNTAWSNITTWVSTQWNRLTDMLRGPVDRAREWIDSALSGIRSAFDSAVSFIREVWDGIIEAIKSPIRFVMVTVIDNGLIAGFNKIADFAGSPKLSPITPPGFAAGGYVDLPWDINNRDPYLGWTPRGPIRFEGEEFIVNRDATRRHRGLLEAINADRYADGGFLGGITSGLASAAEGLIEFITDPLGAMTGIIDRLLGGVTQNPIMQAFVGIPRKLAEMLADWIKSKLVPEAAAIPGGAWSGGLPAAGVITSGYGFRYGPFNGAEHHDGIDIGAPAGTPVHSVLPGVVDVAGVVGGYGNYVSVMSGAVRMFYAHLSAILARVGQVVAAGQVIGLVGSTGWSTGPHLHWGASLNGASINPMSVGGYAAGTASARRGLAWVGEQGPELVDFRGGERVWSARDSATAGTTVVFSPTYTAERSARRDVEDVMAEVRRLAHV